MATDKYTKVVLTVIAACLVVIALRGTPFVASAHAAKPTTCTGELKANAWGGIKESIGGYQVAIECN